MLDFKSLGKRIRDKRVEAGYTQEGLAEKLGYSANHISHIERATTKMSLDCAVDMFILLNISLDELRRYSLKFKTKTEDAQTEDEIWETCTSQEKKFVIDILKVYRNNLNVKMDINLTGKKDIAEDEDCGV